MCKSERESSRLCSKFQLKFKAIFCSRPKVGNTFWQSANCDSWHLNAPALYLLLSLSLSLSAAPLSRSCFLSLSFPLPLCESLSHSYSLSLTLIAVPAASKWNLNRSVYCSLDAIITRSVCHHSFMSPFSNLPLNPLYLYALFGASSSEVFGISVEFNFKAISFSFNFALSICQSANRRQPTQLSSDQWGRRYIGEMVGGGWWETQLWASIVQAAYPFWTRFVGFPFLTFSTVCVCVMVRVRVCVSSWPGREYGKGIS